MDSRQFKKAAARASLPAIACRHYLASPDYSQKFNFTVRVIQFDFHTEFGVPAQFCAAISLSGSHGVMCLPVMLGLPWFSCWSCSSRNAGVIA